jgi:hypothetical protein
MKANDEENDDQIKENQSFFCSELVAACYKRLGLLGREKASS